MRWMCWERAWRSAAVTVLALGAGSVASAAPIAYRDAVLASNPLVYYRLGETSGTSAADASGNGNTGTYLNSPTLGAEGAGTLSDTAVSLTGTSSQYVRANPLGEFGSNLGTTGFAVEFIVKYTQTTQQRLFGTINGPSGSTATALLIDTNTSASGATNGPVRLFLRSESNKTLQVTATPKLNDGNYHHLVFVYDPANSVTGDKLVGYVDGVRATAAFDGTTPDGGFANFGYNVLFGAANDRGALSRPITGTIDEAAFYASPLSAATVAAHYTASGVPEPGTLGLAAVAAAAGLLRRRSRVAVALPKSSF